MTDERLNKIFDRTNGCCHICHKKLTFAKYGSQWEIEHSRPKAKGGSDHSNNLYSAHVSCNREKGTKTTRTARSWHGNTRAPHSQKKLNDIKTTHSLVGAVLGGIVGIVLTPVLGPEMIFAGIALGGAIGNGTAPSK